MAKILKGNVVGKEIRENIEKEIERLHKKDIFPSLGIVRLGDDPSDISYERSIVRNCDKLNIKTVITAIPRETTTEELVGTIEKLNKDDKISGILIFNPLPKHIDDDVIRNTISPDKDVDCMSPVNLGKIFQGDMEGFLPCTPKAAMEVLAYYDIPLEGKNIVVVNRSMVVGKPVAMMLLEENATVTICHSRTKDLHEITSRADVVITALGIPNYFDEKYFHKNSIVIDVGVSEDEEGNLSGDVNFEEISNKVEALTPVIGGVGSVTTSILLSQVVKASKKGLD